MWPPSRRSASSAGSCPGGSTGERPGTSGATSRSGCRSRLTPSAVFVYVDPGHETATALRSWGAAHRELWEALWDRGCGIEVVAIVRTPEGDSRAETVLANWARDPHPSECDHEIGREIVRIEQAIRDKDDRVLKEYGDLQACLKRIVELKDLHRSSSPGTMIHGFTTWRWRRLPGGGF